METKTIIIILALVLFGILPYAATARPGILVTTDPQINTTSGGTVDYKVIITNLDDGLDKTITSLSITISQPGWIYTFDPDLTGVIIPGVNGDNVTTILHVTPSSSITAGQVYNHQITAEAQYRFCGDPNDPTSCFDGSDSNPADLNTIIADIITQIPEFPTIALPIISALGIMLLISRLKKRYP